MRIPLLKYWFNYNLLDKFVLLIFKKNQLAQNILNYRYELKKTKNV